MTEKLVIIGNGMAPGRMLEHLFEKAPGQYRRHDLQRRTARQLRPHHALAGAFGRKDYEQIIIHGDGWYIDHGDDAL